LKLKNYFLLTVSVLVLLTATGCEMFQPTGVSLVNNTGAPLIVTVTDPSALSAGAVLTKTVASNETVMLDLSSEVPLFGSYTNGELSDNNFTVSAEGKYYTDVTQTVAINSMGTLETVTLEANAASVTVTNNTSNTYAKVALDDTVTISFTTTVYGTLTSTSTWAPAGTITIPVKPNQDFLNGYYASGFMGRSGSIGVSDSDIGTDITRSIN
jgi:hypothetical protein